MARETKIAKKIKITTTIFVAIVLFALLQCIAPVSATWTYVSYFPAAPVAQALPLSLSPFAYEYGPDTTESRTLQEVGNKIVAALNNPASTFYSDALTEYVQSMKMERIDPETGETEFLGHRKPRLNEENNGMFISNYDLGYADRPDGTQVIDSTGEWNTELLATETRSTYGWGNFVLTGDFENFASNPTTKLRLFTTLEESTPFGSRSGTQAVPKATPPKKAGKPNMAILEGKMMYRVFRTTIEKIDGRWKITAVELGRAPAGIISSGCSFMFRPPPNVRFEPMHYLGCFDHRRWEPGKWGTKVEEAISINIANYGRIVLADNAEEKVYYAVYLKEGERCDMAMNYGKGWYFEYMKEGDSVWTPASQVELPPDYITRYEYSASCTGPGTYYFRFWGAEIMEFRRAIVTN